MTNFPIEWDEPSQAQMSTDDGFQQPGFTGKTGFGEQVSGGNAYEDSRNEMMSKENLTTAASAFATSNN